MFLVTFYLKCFMSLWLLVCVYCAFFYMSAQCCYIIDHFFTSGLLSLFDVPELVLNVSSQKQWLTAKSLVIWQLDPLYLIVRK